MADEAQLGLTTHQRKQVEQQMASAEGAITARLPETWKWLLVPMQVTPAAAVSWDALRLTGTDALAVRASKKLRSDELYLTSFAPTRLRLELDKIPLWRGDHVSIKQLVEDFARYLYLPRLKHSGVLLDAISDGVSLLTWAQEGFGFADSFDEAAGRYKGLRGGLMVNLSDPHSPALLVKPDVASKQIESEQPRGGASEPSSGNDDPVPAPAVSGGVPAPVSTAAGSKPKRFHGAISLDANRVGRDAGKIAQEVIAHLCGLVGANVSVTLQISADIPDGVPDNVVRTVTENARTLKFDAGSGFERD